MENVYGNRHRWKHAKPTGNGGQRLIGSAGTVTQFASAIFTILLVHRTSGAGVDRAIALLVSMRRCGAPERDRRDAYARDLKASHSPAMPDGVEE